MRLLSEKPYTPLSFITTIAACVLAGVFLYISAIQLGTIIAAAPIGNYLSPDFPERAQMENTIVDVTLLICAGVLVYSIFRPIPGGILLCIYSAIFGFVFNAFHLCTVLYPARGARFFTSWSAMTVIILLMGILFILRGIRASKESGNGFAPAA